MVTVEDRCPHLIVKSAHDEKHDEVYTAYLCGLTERASGRMQPCTREYGYGCETYDEWINGVGNDKL